MNISDILILTWLHFFSDFILQSDKVAVNKSKSLSALAFHCLVYSCPFIFFGVEFAAITFALHFSTDLFTSKISSYYFMTDQRRKFFLTIGFDQMVHATSLICALEWVRA